VLRNRDWTESGKSGGQWTASIGSDVGLVLGKATADAVWGGREIQLQAANYSRLQTIHDFTPTKFHHGRWGQSFLKCALGNYVARSHSAEQVPSRTQTDSGTSFTIVNHDTQRSYSQNKATQQFSCKTCFIVFWLVLMLKVLHEIIVTIEVLQDTVPVGILAKHAGFHWETYRTLQSWI